MIIMVDIVSFRGCASIESKSETEAKAKQKQKTHKRANKIVIIAAFHSYTVVRHFKTTQTSTY